ncbi:hypothetical protein llap_15555 [Limosa lapponica baueri]|uniref:Uncharacterized protein n=1 Tax=Limosa lapponica baueri TaxID=1758121 RepID=A0A2I0TJZ6_LIMLA|nr:hypothetical protein llap_15555 [Limosa lapponica baueri]
MTCTATRGFTAGPLKMTSKRLSLAFHLFSGGYSEKLPPSLSLQSCFKPFIPQPVLILGVALTQMQDPALGIVEPHEVHMGPLLKPVQVPLDAIRSLRCVNHSTQLGVICKLAEDVLDPTVYVIDEDTEQ